ncbi:sensor domain-containing diguanylate cyclase [Clostridium arbusti]|uniref:sensor domain-containing diguanylate cyclase n=1 Tax=Clostridium arbusti TaxID=1137848 RepID=UPI00028A2FA1|nr:GGDEF domain-containing protein [Clostridium arbusti]
MDKILSNVLNDINEGVILTDEDLAIIYWNNHMEYVTGISSESVINKKIYDILQNLNKPILKNCMKDIVINEYRIFLSAAIHKNLLDNDRYVNLDISKVNYENKSIVLFQFSDVTNQFLHIAQLKNHVNELYVLNNELKKKEKTINKLAYYDYLTGISNRRLFYKLTTEILQKKSEGSIALMVIDIDKFKSVNDTYGHKKGDEVIVAVSKIISKSINKGDLAARFGGDEFLVVMNSFNDYKDIEDTLSKIFSEKIKVSDESGSVIEVTLSLGIVIDKEYDKKLDVDILILKADKAMYEAKKSGGNCWRYYK